MGQSESSYINDDPEDDPFDGIDTLGYRVLGVQPNSPAAKAGLVSFLDFLVGCNNVMLLGSGADLEPGQEYDDVDVPHLLQSNKGKELEFLVWNIKSQQARMVQLTPNDDWGGAGLLGVTIRLDNYAGAEERLVRVLNVQPHSPAAISGLQSNVDFLLGTTHQTLDSVDRLALDVLQPNVDKVVELYVYNSETDVVREVALMPTLAWENSSGLLGAEVGTGYLHRLPGKVRDTSGKSIQRKVKYVNDNTVQSLPQLEMELPQHERSSSGPEPFPEAPSTGKSASEIVQVFQQPPPQKAVTPLAQKPRHHAPAVHYPSPVEQQREILNSLSDDELDAQRPPAPSPLGPPPKVAASHPRQYFGTTSSSSLGPPPPRPSFSSSAM